MEFNHHLFTEYLFCAKCYLGQKRNMRCSYSRMLDHCLTNRLSQLPRRSWLFWEFRGDRTSEGWGLRVLGSTRIGEGNRAAIVGVGTVSGYDHPSGFENTGARLPGFHLWFCHLLALPLYSSHLFSRRQLPSSIKWRDNGTSHVEISRSLNERTYVQSMAHNMLSINICYLTCKKHKGRKTGVIT